MEKFSHYWPNGLEKIEILPDGTVNWIGLSIPCLDEYVDDVHSSGLYVALHSRLEFMGCLSELAKARRRLDEVAKAMEPTE